MSPFRACVTPARNKVQRVELWTNTTTPRCPLHLNFQDFRGLHCCWHVVHRLRAASAAAGSRSRHNFMKSKIEEHTPSSVPLLLLKVLQRCFPAVCYLLPRTNWRRCCLRDVMRNDCRPSPIWLLTWKQTMRIDCTGCIAPLIPRRSKCSRRVTPQNWQSHSRRRSQ